MFLFCFYSLLRLQGQNLKLIRKNASGFGELLPISHHSTHRSKLFFKGLFYPYLIYFVSKLDNFTFKSTKARGKYCESRVHFTGIRFLTIK